MKPAPPTLFFIVIVLVAGLVCQAFGAILVKLASDVPPTMIATYRMLFSAVILVSIWMLRGQRIRFDRPTVREAILCMLSGFFVALHFITWITSLQYTTVAASVMLVNMNAIFVGLLAFVLFREKQSVSLVVSIAIAFLGCSILTVGDSEFKGFIIDEPGIFLGNLLAICGAFASSFYLLIGSRVRLRLNLLTYITLVYSSAAILLSVLSIATGLSFTGYRSESYLYLILLAVFPQLFGHSAFNWSLKHLKSSVVAVAKMGEPICAAGLAYLFFSETVNALQLVGLALIFLAISFAFRKG